MYRRLSCFKAYDVRGRIPDQLDEDVARRIGRAFAAALKPKKVVVGRDIRLSSPAMANAVSAGLIDGGADVLDIGLCGTEEVYFATSHLAADGGIMVTASHNPADFNGMKFVREGSRPISGDSGLDDIRVLAEQGEFERPAKPGRMRHLDPSAAFVEHLMTYVDRDALKPLKIVVNAGNGGAGVTIDRLERHLAVQVHQAPS